MDKLCAVGVVIFIFIELSKFYDMGKMRAMKKQLFILDVAKWSEQYDIIEKKTDVTTN